MTRERVNERCGEAVHEWHSATVSRICRSIAAPAFLTGVQDLDSQVQLEPRPVRSQDR